FYNQGNNKERIFLSRDNQLFFLEKFRKFVLPHCNVLAYCLMPNHFHFLISTTEASTREIKVGALNVTALNNGFRMLLSSYAQAFNKQINRTGSLFRQRTKSKLLDESKNYPYICFNYVHQNPMVAGLVSKMEDWEFSSFQDYTGMRNGTLCDKTLATQLLDLDLKTLYDESYQIISEEKQKEMY
ncbi:MAG: transposase, partial [Ekhidna sp.]